MVILKTSVTPARAVIERIAKNFLWNDGIWTSPHLAETSYPEESRNLCFAVEDKSLWFAHRSECLRVILNRFKNPGIFLDLGGGNGYVTKTLLDLGIEAILVEPGIASCRNAQKRKIDQIICGSIEELSFEDQKVQSVGIFDVLEHMRNEKYFLSMIHHALEEKGRLFLTVPAHPWLWSHEDEAAGHYRRYSFKSLEEVLSRNGFKLLYQSYFFEPLVWPVFFFRHLPYRLGRKHTGYTQEKLEKDHMPNHSVISRILKKMLQRETPRLSNATIANGTSIIAVAEKIPTTKPI